MVLANFASAAVLDRETGLVWQRAVNAQTSGAFATQLCRSASTGGRFGWRLPTLGEAASLFDPTVAAVPSLPTGHPFTGFDPAFAFLWTASRDPRNPQTSPDRAYIVNAVIGSTVFVNAQTSASTANDRLPFLCVRGGGSDYTY